MHSTVTSLLEVLNDVLSALVQKGFVVVLAMFDLSAAFNTIEHAFLPSCLHEMYRIHDQAFA